MVPLSMQSAMKRKKKTPFRQRGCIYIYLGNGPIYIKNEEKEVQHYKQSVCVQKEDKAFLFLEL